jgi:hypothetical protein
MLSSATRAELAADLAEAERTRVPMGPLTAAHPDIDVVDAYEIQLINIRQRIAEGATVAQIAETTGWASHTVRGFLAGLKKKGIEVTTLERVRMVGPNRDGAKGSYTRYAIAG